MTDQGSEDQQGGEGGAAGRLTPPRSYAAKFDELFPFYLALGMTYELYWERDCTLVRSYRKAFELRQKLEDQSAWLQGMYIYDALVKTAPYLRSFKPKRPEAYPSRPYGMKHEAEKPRRGKAPPKYDTIRKNMEIFAINFNKRFKDKQTGGDVDGR